MEPKPGKKARKYGRNIIKCGRYKSEGRRFKNKVRRLVSRWKHYKKQPPKAINGIKDNIMRNVVLSKLAVR